MNFNTIAWQRKLNQIEPYYFYLFVTINLIPALSFELFPTADGPAHLYNSKVIAELIYDPSSSLSDFFSFNSSLNPNSSGHFLLWLFVSVFPYFVAEKIILVFYLIGLPLSMRFMFKTLAIDNKYLLYLVFPFTYSFLFFYGFYNFNIGVVLFIWGLALWIKHLNKLTFKNGAILAFISTLICFSHVFVFMLFLLAIFILNITNLISRKLVKKADMVTVFKLVVFQLIILSFGLSITILYLFNLPANNTNSDYFTNNEILSFLMNISPSKGINYGKANVFTQWIFYVILYLLLNILFYKLKARFNKTQYKLKNQIILWLTLTTLILVFLLPNGMGAGGFITHRLILFFFIFLLIWLASQHVSIYTKTLVFAISTYVSVALILHNKKSIYYDSKVVEEVVQASMKLTPNSTVLPIIDTDNFILGHVSNYLGVKKPMVILENYEANLSYFPLRWNCIEMPQLLFGNLKKGNICVDWESSKNEIKVIDYVFVLSSENRILADSCRLTIDNCLDSHYQLIFEGKYGVKVYEKLDKPRSNDSE